TSARPRGTPRCCSRCSAMTESVDIEIHLPATLRAVAGSDAVSVSAATIEQAIDALIALHPRLRRHLFAEDGELRGYVNIFLNEEELRTLPAGAATPLAAGDVITILPSVAGGLIGANA